MTRFPLAIGILWAVALLGGRELWINIPVLVDTALSSESAIARGMARPPHTRADMEGPRVDLYGNEVEDALAEYQIDGPGGVYERHSPEIAMPKPSRPEI